MFLLIDVSQPPGISEAELSSAAALPEPPSCQAWRILDQRDQPQDAIFHSIKEELMSRHILLK